jgi:hypothetical protein
VYILALNISLNYLECGGLSVVINEVSLIVISESYLPASGKWQLLGHGAMRILPLSYLKGVHATISCNIHVGHISLIWIFGNCGAMNSERKETQT